MLNKKAMTIFLCLTMVLASMTGCGTANGSKEQLPGTGDPETKNVVNTKFEKSGMQNLRGEPFLYEDGTADEFFGFGYAFTKQMKLFEESYRISTNRSQLSYFQLFSFISEKLALEMKTYFEAEKEPTEEERKAFWKKVDAEQKFFAGIFRFREGDETSEEYKSYMDETFAYKKSIATIGKDTYYFAYNDSFPNVEYSDADKETLKSVLKEIDQFAGNLCVFPVREIPKASLSNFDATTITGDTWTAADLAKYEITMVNIWATWCPPCISEMPELQKLYEKLPDGVNLISLCADAESEPELAAEIVDMTGIKYPVLVVNEDLMTMLRDTTVLIPTTFFFDGKGNMVGNAIAGVPRGNVAEKYLKAINERLEAVKNQ